MKFIAIISLLVSGFMAYGSPLKPSDVVAAIVQTQEGEIEVWFNSYEQWVEEGRLSDWHPEEYDELLSEIVDEANLCNSMENTYNPCREGRTIESIKKDLLEIGVNLDPDFQAWADEIVADGNY